MNNLKHINENFMNLIPSEQIKEIWLKYFLYYVRDTPIFSKFDFHRDERNFKKIRRLGYLLKSINDVYKDDIEIREKLIKIVYPHQKFKKFDNKRYYENIEEEIAAISQLPSFEIDTTYHFFMNKVNYIQEEIHRYNIQKFNQEDYISFKKRIQEINKEKDKFQELDLIYNEILKFEKVCMEFKLELKRENIYDNDFKKIYEKSILIKKEFTEIEKRLKEEIKSIKKFLAFKDTPILEEIQDKFYERIVNIDKIINNIDSKLRLFKQLQEFFIKNKKLFEIINKYSNRLEKEYALNFMEYQKELNNLLKFTKKITELNNSIEEIIESNRIEDLNWIEKRSNFNVKLFRELNYKLVKFITKINKTLLDKVKID